MPCVKWGTSELFESNQQNHLGIRQDGNKVHSSLITVLDNFQDFFLLIILCALPFKFLSLLIYILWPLCNLNIDLFESIIFLLNIYFYFLTLQEFLEKYVIITGFLEGTSSTIKYKFGIVYPKHKCLNVKSFACINIFLASLVYLMGFPSSSVVKNPPANAGDSGFIPPPWR